MDSTTNVLNTFEQEIDAAVSERRFVRLEYMTELHEFIKADVLVKGRESASDTDMLLLATGQEVPVKKIVSINGVISPNYPGYDNYSCDC